MTDARETDSTAEISLLRIVCCSEVEIDPECAGARSRSKRERAGERVVMRDVCQPRRMKRLQNNLRRYQTLVSTYTLSHSGTP